MRVISLQAQNILRLSAVSITWDREQAVLTIGGKNGAGKSSVVNALAMAIGGADMCPDEPLKHGEVTGFVEVDFDDLVVRREFYQETLGVPPNASIVTKSKLVVKNKENIVQGTPQKLLDRFVSKLTFDPMVFLEMDAKPQDDLLRRLAAIDVSEFETRRQAAATLRTTLNRDLQEAVTRLQGLTQWPSTPPEEISMAEVSAELERANNARSEFEKAARQVEQIESDIVQQQATFKTIDEQINALDAERERLMKLHTGTADKIVGLGEHLDVAKARKETLDGLVPNITIIKDRLSEVETINNHVRANKAFAAEQAVIVTKKTALDEQDGIVADMVEAKRKALTEAQLPVAGLALSETNGVMFNGVPLKQASTAEQIRVSVAIGFALNPGLKLLLVRNGNALDEDSMKLVADEAAKAGGQILMEYVTKNAGDVSVFIEDGHVGG